MEFYARITHGHHSNHYLRHAGVLAVQGRTSWGFHSQATGIAMKGVSRARFTRFLKRSDHNVYNDYGIFAIVADILQIGVYCPRDGATTRSEMHRIVRRF